MADASTFDREVRGLRSAMEQYGIERGVIVTWDEQADLGDGVQAIPVWKWLLA